MTTAPYDDSTSLLCDRLPALAADLYRFVMAEHADRRGQLGCAWWRVVRDSYQGTGGFMRSVRAVSTRDGGLGNYDNDLRATTAASIRDTYLTKFRRENADAFQARADRSPYENHVAPVVDVYHGHLVRRRAERSSTVAAINEWQKDVDGHGCDIGEWVAGVALRTQLNGWTAVLVDRPRESDGPAQTTVTALEPEELRDWQIGRDGQFDWARIVSEWCERDPSTGADVELVEATLWTRDEWARVRLEKPAGGEWAEVLRDGDIHDLGRVPIAVLRWQEQLTPRALYGLSQVQGVVPLVLSLFNVESELTDHLANANFSLLARQVQSIGQSNDLVLGTNNGVEYEVGCAAPAFIAPAADVALQYALRMEALIAAIYTTAKMERPGVTQTGGDAASGIAKAYDFSQTDAVLAAFARQLTRFEYELVALVSAYANLGDAKKIAADVAATKIAYPTRFDAAGIAADLGAQFAVLDDKIRAQVPPAVLKQARLTLARLLYPEAPADVETAVSEQIETMYQRELATATSERPHVSELFGYDLDAGLITVNQYLAGKGLEARSDGNVTIIEWRIAHGLNPDGSLPKAPDGVSTATPADHAAEAAAHVADAVDVLPSAASGDLTSAP